TRQPRRALVRGAPLPIPRRARPRALGAREVVGRCARERSASPWQLLQRLQRRAAGSARRARAGGGGRGFSGGRAGGLVRRAGAVEAGPRFASARAWPSWQRSTGG